MITFLGGPYLPSVSISRKFLRQVISYIRHIRCILDEYPNHTLCLSDGSKSKHKSVYAYSINRSLVSHRIRNKAFVFTAERVAIFSFLSHLTLLPPHGRFLLLTDSLSSLESLSNRFSTNPLIQRIHLTLHSLHSIGSQIIFIWIPATSASLNTTLSLRQRNRPLPFQKYRR